MTTRRAACFAFMTCALEAPMELQCHSPKDARSWRFQMYNLRKAISTNGDKKFDKLVLKIKKNVLTAEKKDGPS